MPSLIDWAGVRIPLQLFYYTRQTYEHELAAAGLRDVAWHEPVLPPEFRGGSDSQRWQVYLDHPLFLVLECTKPE
ncbi:hypothetical protein ACIA8G_09505 [Lentzea sp. NPDC051213]|uniref:hypothetical protein n=1 Tax=Lentzea sp. NPDC051213 TaxID=3364126 RepID=UPI00378D37BB